MVMMWIPLPLTMQVMAYIMFIIGTPVFVYVAYPIFRAAGMALRNRSLNMDVMYAMGDRNCLWIKCIRDFQYRA